MCGDHDIVRFAPRYLTEKNLAGRQLDDRGRNCTVPPGYEHGAAFRWLKL